MAKHMPRYPPEFRAEAIRLARTSGKPHAEIARELGRTGETLRLWLKRGGRREAQRRPHDRGAGGTAAVTARGSPSARRAGDPEKSRGLLCAGGPHPSVGAPPVRARREDR